MIKIKKTGDIATKRFTALIVGPSGIGKTSLVKTLPDPESKILLVSAESGLACLDGTSIDVLELDPLKPMESLEWIYEQLGTKEYLKKYSYVFVDSITEIGQLIITQLKKDAFYGQAKNTLPMYGKYNELMTTVIKGYRDLSDYSVIFTCLDAVEKDGLEKLESFNVPGSQVKNNLKAWFDLVLFYKIYKDEEGNAIRKLVTDIAESPLAKDRTGKLEAYEDADLSVIINKITGSK
jgi:phage nucleotide-binding protein